MELDIWMEKVDSAGQHSCSTSYHNKMQQDLTSKPYYFYIYVYIYD